MLRDMARECGDAEIVCAIVFLLRNKLNHKTQTGKETVKCRFIYYRLENDLGRYDEVK
jgi:hypothetical protein